MLVLVHRRSPLRLTTALVVVLALLFSQWALASYACPGQADADAVAAAMPCHGMDAAQPVLCHQHAAGAAQSFEPAQPPVPSLPAIVQVLDVPAVPVAAATPALPPTALPEAHPPPDPVFLATLRLRV